LLLKGKKMAKVKIGECAPGFTLPSSTGENISLSQLLGKKNVVLFFYPRDEGPTCCKEAEAFRDNYEAFKASNAEVIGISAQSVESHKSFASHHKLQYGLLSDSDNKVRQLYGVSSTLGIPGRVTFVIDKEGIVKYVFSSQLHFIKHAKEALLALRE
jgi:thioredoxin-dependent peroxiredoxin